MDQCDDCSEVVCASCSTLLSCKFCGGGLCEECATACGRCGIVLCARDAKFAVECDTCKLSYCLVCLASGTKDPCVRCGQRPSKRVEQLVHLRLKSIYKAFKQSGAHNKGGAGNGGGGRDDVHADDHEEYNHSDDDDIQTDSCGGGSNDVGAVLQAAAAAAAASNKVSTSGGHHGKSPPSSMEASSNSHKEFSNNRTTPLEKFRVKQQEADAAAAALLAELEEEEVAAETANKSKKSKKKRKKERQQAKKDEEQKKKNAEVQKKQEKQKKVVPQIQKQQQKQKQSQEPLQQQNSNTMKMSDKSSAPAPEVKKERLKVAKKPAKESLKKKNDQEEDKASFDDDPKELDILLHDATPKKEDVDETEKLLCEMVAEGDADGIEALLASLKGIPGRAALRKNAKKALKRLRESNEGERAATSEKEEKESRVPTESSLPTNTDVGGLHPRAETPNQSEISIGYKAPEPLLKLVSHTHRPAGQTTQTTIASNAAGSLQRARSTGSAQPPQSSVARSECVMHMAPSVVGWVIGKGGQRIRDLMEESGAKVWIDQDNMTQQDPRVVYVSGNRKSVDSAVRMIKELVAKAPVGSAGGTPLSTSIPPTAAGTSPIPGKPPLIPDSDLKQPDTSKQGITKPSPVQALPPPNLNMRSSRLDDPQPPTQQTHEHVAMRRNDSASPFAHGNTETTNKGDWDVHEMTCESRFVPLLIGRRGWTIKHIQDSSGARVDIDQTVTPRLIKISGKSHCVRSAIRMVRDVLSYPHAQLHYHGAQEETHGDEKMGVHPNMNSNIRVDANIGKEGPKDLSFDRKEQPTLDGEEILKAALEKSLRNEDNSGSHSPPPSSLNIKSTISASSSLSSTPEPSMASAQSAKNYYKPVPPGAVLAPELFVPQTGVTGDQQLYSARGPTTAGPERNIPGRNVNTLGNEVPPIYSSGLVGMNNTDYQKQTNLTGDPRYAGHLPPAPGLVQNQQPALVVPQMMPDVGRSGFNEFGTQNVVQHPQQGLRPEQGPMQNSNSMEFLPMHQQQNQQAPMYQSSSLLFEGRSSAPTPTPARMNIPNSGSQPMFFGGAGPKTDAYASDPWAGEAGAGAVSSTPDGIGQGPLINAGADNFQREQLCPPVQVPGANRVQETPLSYGGMRGSTSQNAPVDSFNFGGHPARSITQPTQEDSNLVDNLFGPSSAGAEQNLLGDALQNMSLKDSGIGGWGSSIADWGVEPAVDNEIADQSGFGFQQPPDLHHQRQQPSSSRLNWG